MRKSLQHVRSSKSHADQWALTTHDSSLESEVHAEPNESASPHICACRRIFKIPSSTRISQSCHRSSPELSRHPVHTKPRSGHRMTCVDTHNRDPAICAFLLMELSPGTPLCAAFSLRPHDTPHNAAQVNQSARADDECHRTRGPSSHTTRGPLAHNDPLHPTRNTTWPTTQTRRGTPHTRGTTKARHSRAN